MFEQLGYVPNPFSSTVSLLSLGVFNMPFVLTNQGHLAIKIDEFPEKYPEDFAEWKPHDGEIQLPKLLLDGAVRRRAVASDMLDNAIQSFATQFQDYTGRVEVHSTVPVEEPMESFVFDTDG